MPRLSYRPAAVADLDAIFDFIAADTPSRAVTFVTGIRERCRTLLDHAWLGPAREDLGPGIRILAASGRVVIAYRVHPAGIEVIRVFYGGQDYEAILRADAP